MTLKTTFITLNNGTKICAPADVNLMTNFVLNEQGDWFENEIHFVRHFVQPGMMALDIGANYGLYSTAIAMNLGENGRLWCFEPTQNTADALRKTISKNNLDDSIELIQAGLSDHKGQATFYTSPNAELNSLTQASFTTGEKQTIELLTLDECFDKYQWENLDFIKLDAEGEELNILKAAKKTLSKCSPLIMYELKHGNEVNMPLITAFEDLGYKPFYLIPGLNVLCPFNKSQQLDAFQLNLFCCKEETANDLAVKGFLVKEPKPYTKNEHSYCLQFYNTRPYAKNIELNTEEEIDGKGKLYKEIFNFYANSRDESLSTESRLKYLVSAYECVKLMLGKGESKIERLCTMARVASDIGQQSICFQIVEYIKRTYLDQHKPIIITDEFVPPCSDYELVPIKNNIADWLSASVLETFICNHSFSCYFSNPTATLPVFDTLEKLNLLSKKMKLCQKMVVAKKVAISQR